MTLSLSDEQTPTIIISNTILPPITIIWTLTIIISNTILPPISICVTDTIRLTDTLYHYLNYYHGQVINNTVTFDEKLEPQL